MDGRVEAERNARSECDSEEDAQEKLWRGMNVDRLSGDRATTIEERENDIVAQDSDAWRGITTILSVV